MTNSTQHRSWIPGIRGRAAGAALALAIMLVPAVLATGSAQAQTYTESVLHTFTGPPDGAALQEGAVQDAEGNLYGTTFYGGDSACNTPYGCGTVYKLAPPAQSGAPGLKPCSTASPGLGATAQIPG